jgi:hypothetical protein
VTTKYAAAMDAYTKVIESKSVDADYAYFKSYFLVLCLKNDKIDEINAFTTVSKIRIQRRCTFELANHVAENQNDLAVKRTTD